MAYINCTPPDDLLTANSLVLLLTDDYARALEAVYTNLRRCVGLLMQILK